MSRAEPIAEGWEPCEFCGCPINPGYENTHGETCRRRQQALRDNDPSQAAHVNRQQDPAEMRAPSASESPFPGHAGQSAHRSSPWRGQPNTLGQDSAGISCGLETTFWRLCATGLGGRMEMWR